MPQAQERARIVDVCCELSGSWKLVKLVLEGSQVRRGAVVGELDASTLKERAIDRSIVTNTAEARYNASLTNRKIAEIALDEYEEGTYPKQLRDAKIEAELANEEATIAQEELDRIKNSPDPDELALRRAALALTRSKLAAARADLHLEALPKFMKPAETTRLRADIERARSDELRGLGQLKIEQRKEADLRKQIDRCKLTAPCDGVVIYPSTRAGVDARDGATVHAGDLIFRVVGTN